MGFSWQEYWSGLPGPPPVDLPNPGIEPTSLISPALAGGFFTTPATWSVIHNCIYKTFHFIFKMSPPEPLVYNPP